MNIAVTRQKLKTKFQVWFVAFWPFTQEPTWWRDQAGWWCQPSASTLKPASSSLCSAPARTTKRRRSRKVRHETKPVTHVSKTKQIKTNHSSCWSVKGRTRTVIVRSVGREVWLERRLSSCQLLNISTLLFEQCRLEIFARFYQLVLIWSFSCHTSWLCQWVDFIQSGLITAELFEGSNCSILTLSSFNLIIKTLSVNKWDHGWGDQ